MDKRFDYFRAFKKDEWDIVERSIQRLVHDKRVTTDNVEFVVGSIMEGLHGPGPELYDPAFGDERQCVCGHSYHRHFDSYEDMDPVGCKYFMDCGCKGFKEAK